MNIGFVSQALPYLPSRGGFRAYGGNLIRCLSRRHCIDLVSLLVDDDAEHLDWAQHHCASVRTIAVNGTRRFLAPFSALSAYLWGRPLQQRRQLHQILRSCTKQWDVIHVEGGYAGGIIPPPLPIAKVLSLHDSGTLRCEQMLKCSQGYRERLYYTLLKYHEPRYERLVYPRFERCVVVTDGDLAAVRETVPNANVQLIPYGIDTAYFNPVSVEKQEAALVFHGHLGYAPNIEAALEFAHEIFPLIRRQVRNATFHLVAAEPVPKITALVSHPGIKLSVNPPDVRPAVCSARIYVCPMRHGTGMKTKMLEAMAMQLPIVCYAAATAGIKYVQGKHLFVARDPEECAAHVLDVLKHPQRAEEIASAARRLAVEEYSWESRAQAFEELYEQAIIERKGRTKDTSGH